MNQSIRFALDMWHYKTQAQIWRKQLLNHTTEYMNKGKQERQRNRKADGAKARKQILKKKRIRGTGFGHGSLF